MQAVSLEHSIFSVCMPREALPPLVRTPALVYKDPALNDLFILTHLTIGTVSILELELQHMNCRESKFSP